jgi:hypothetical protein
MKNEKEFTKARNLMFIFLAASLILAALFIYEYIKAPNTSILGRVPLLVVSLGLFAYYVKRYFTLK